MKSRLKSRSEEILEMSLFCLKKRAERNGGIPDITPGEKRGLDSLIGIHKADSLGVQAESEERTAINMEKLTKEKLEKIMQESRIMEED